MNSLGNKEIMAKNIRHYLDINNLTNTDICKTLGFSMSTFSDWIHARTYPRIDKIELMANYFGIEKSDLVEDKSRLSSKDAKEISKILENTELLLKQEGLMFDGEPASPESVNSIISAMKIGMEMAKQNNKKYTPNKFKHKRDD